MEKNKTLKIILIIIAIILVLFLGNAVRKYVVIKGLQTKISEVSLEKGLHATSTYTEKEGTKTVRNLYVKGDKSLLITEETKDGVTRKISTYSNGKTENTYYEDEAGKRVELNKTSTMPKKDEVLKTDSNWKTFTEAIKASVKSEELNNKKCYLIKDFGNMYSEMYVERDTGLSLKVTTKDTKLTTETSYELENVNDSIFEEPNQEEYTIYE